MNLRSPVQTKTQSSFTPVQTGILQRKCAACGQHTIAGEACPECQKKRSLWQRRATNQTETSEVPPVVHEVLRSPGQSLGLETRNFMEAYFAHHADRRESQSRKHPSFQFKSESILSMDRHEQEADDMADSVSRLSDSEATDSPLSQLSYDFSRVRVHTDTKAAESARSINALAYTTGQNIAFASGQYAPTTPTGQRLLAHELTHVVQQTYARVPHSIQRREDPGAVVAPVGATPPPRGGTGVATRRPSPDNRTPQEIVVVDFGVNQNIFNWREAFVHIGEIEAQSVDRMVRDVMQRAGDPAQNCIRRLVLNGHGSPGSISVGDGTGWVVGGHISAGNFRPSLASLIPYFCDGATVVLFGCNVGRGATGIRFIQALADYWQVNVSAPTGDVNGFGIQGVWVWGIPGQVLPSDAALLVDQIVRILDEIAYGDDEEMIFELLEAGRDRGILVDIRTALEGQNRWNSLRDDLIDEDESRYRRLFPQ